MDDCWNYFISSSIDVILIWLLFILIWFCVVSKWWWDLVNCMVWLFLLYDGLNQICKPSVYHLMVKEKCQCWVFNGVINSCIRGQNCLDPVNSAVWQFLMMDACWNCFISSSIDVILIWLLFILIWFHVVSKWWWDLVNCMVWIFLLYDGLIQICKLSVYCLMVKEKCWWWVFKGVINSCNRVKLLGSSKFCCLVILTDDCWNCFIASSNDVILNWLLFILIWICVVSKWWWDLVNCMVWIFLLYDGSNQICKLSVYCLMVKEKC
jgi:hypothetical protein